MQRNLLDDFDSSDDEDNTIPIEFVNKIIYDYLVDIGYENTGAVLLKESPIQNSKSTSVQNIIQNFSSRVKKLNSTSGTVKMVDGMTQCNFDRMSIEKLKTLNPLPIRTENPKIYENVEDNIDEEIELFKKNGNEIVKKKKKSIQPSSNTHFKELSKRVENIENFLDLKEEKEMNLRLKQIEDKIIQMEEKGFFMNQSLFDNSILPTTGTTNEDTMDLENELDAIIGGNSPPTARTEENNQIDSRINELKNFLVQQK
eukprot:gene2070-1942_t